MLLALRVRNFKSIRSADVRFGPLTCFIGHNGVGKSNLFDAIHFLSLLAEVDIHEAAARIRHTTDGTSSPLDLLYGRDPDATVEIAADMIVPSTVWDDFEEPTKPSTTLLRYEISLNYEQAGDRLVVSAERLSHIKFADFRSFVGFEHSRAFRQSVALGSRRGGPLISTDETAGAIRLHGDGGSRGRPLPVGKSPLTVVGGTNTVDYPTVLGAKREMESWKLLHLEPSSMRAPDRRSADPHVTDSGAHLAATLNALLEADPDIRHELVNRLRELNSDVHEVNVDYDKTRDQLALQARVSDVDSWLYARSLSDGTLRYIALTVMLLDVHDRGVLCLEEPENGIHPSRVPELVDLLRDYAVDPSEAVDLGNPLRQVVINTHSPEVARQLSPDDLVFVERGVRPDGPSASVFRPIAGAWRVSSSNGFPGSAGSTSRPKDLQALADFIGGSPLGVLGERQLAFDFGTAQ